jgi:hypothetical protein
MPADAVAGLFEAIAALLQAIAELAALAVEGTVTLIELAIEGIFLVIELAFLLIGKRRSIGRPAWVVRRRQSTAGRIKSLITAVLFIGSIAYGAFQYFGYTRLSFSQSGIFQPNSVEALLIRGETTQVAVIEKGELKVRRGRWDRLVIRDTRYRPDEFTLSGRRMKLRLENIQTTRDVATKAVIDKAADLLRKKFGKPEESKPVE